MRIRSIKPEFFHDDRLAEQPALARILFAGLWCAADGWGRLEDRPRRIKADVLPYDDCDIDSMLGTLHAAGFIQRYEVDGRRLIQVTNFRKHQRISGEEASKASEFPAPCDKPKQSRSSPEAVTASPRSSGEGPIALEGKGREGKGDLSTDPMEKDLEIVAPGRSDAEGLWSAFQTARRDLADTGVDGFTPVPTPRPPEAQKPAGWDAWAAAALGGVGVDAVPRLVCAYRIWLRDKRGEWAKKRPIPWPTQVFMSPNVWRSRVPEARGVA